MARYATGPRANKNAWIGTERVSLYLRKLGSKEYAKIVKNAAMPSALLLSRASSRHLQSSPVFKQHATDAGYSKLLKVAGDIKPKRLRASVAVQPDWKKDDVFVKGSKRPRWTTWGWANLLMKGRGGGKEKGGVNRARNRYTGTTKGAGDYVLKAERTHGKFAMNVFKKNLLRGVSVKERGLRRRYLGR